MKKLLVLLLLIPYSLFAQKEHGKISGSVIDEQTKQPIENVNIYIAKSLIGTSTNKNGKFNLAKIPTGRYEVIFSHVSYLNHSEKIEILGNRNINLDIVLSPKPIEFPDVDVVDKYDDEWEDNFEKFKEGLLGKTEFADACTIENPYTVSFEKDDNGILYAHADGPLKIINEGLGYEVTFFLKHFEMSFYDVLYSGLPFFKELPCSSEEQKKMREYNRLRAYMGSLRHFLRSLAESYQLIREGKDSVKLVIDLEDATDNGVKYFYDDKMFLSKQGFAADLIEPIKYVHLNKFMLHPFFPDSVVAKSKNPNELYFVCDKLIQIVYDKEYDDLTYDPQVSRIALHADSVYFDKMGRYYDEFTVQTFGYMSKQRLSEILPFEYEPSDSLLINTDFR